MDNKDYIYTFRSGDTSYKYFSIEELEHKGLADISRLPYSIRVLTENLLRKFDADIITEQDILNISNWQTTYDNPVEIPFHPARVLMQDFTGVPAVVDLAAMRDAVADLGGDPSQINPQVPVELVVDHSVQVDYSRTNDSLQLNVEKEYERNHERYRMLKWAQKSFDNFNVVPPNSGICHQVNLEYLGRTVISENTEHGMISYPDTVVGLDSHTPMINAIGVVGWGVGGIEAEAVMLGQPYYMVIPEVIGVELSGKLRPGITATDLVLTLTEMLRKADVVEKFVEFYGDGMQSLSIPDRATIANMAPEYGATIGFFPVDEKTLQYLELTDRKEYAAVAREYTQANRMFYHAGEDDKRVYTSRLKLDLATVEPSLAGPSRPQDRIVLSGVKKRFQEIIGQKAVEYFPFDRNGRTEKLSNGSIVIAAITSCTNTSNPSVLIGAGLLAKAAVQRGLRVASHVKTSFAPGSRVVSDYLKAAKLMPYFEALGFHVTAFGCTTCIGNSGPLDEEIEKTIADNNLNVAAILSGNRNFEARIHQLVQSNFLASPMLVVAFALAGRIDIDLTNEPIGFDPNGKAIFLNEIWPDENDIASLVNTYVTEDRFTSQYKKIFSGDHYWDQLTIDGSTTYPWDAASSYIKRPPYFEGFKTDITTLVNIEKARIFLMLGDTVTTDHISPAGAIPPDYPAGQYLIENGVSKANFNSYGARRGNHEVMMRGTFGNIRIKNKLITPKEGSYTIKYPEKKEMFNFDAATHYAKENVPLIVLAGKEYGTGSSRDWAAKGSNLLGIKAIIAESYERIHRNNLVGMGVLPLIFKNGNTFESLGLRGDEQIFIEGLDEISPGKDYTVKAISPDGRETCFIVGSRLDTAVDVKYYLNGGILPYVLRNMLRKK